jgi:hypothetical protein
METILGDHVIAWTLPGGSDADETTGDSEAP